LLSYDTTMALSKKQRKILDQIFEQPVRSDVVWTDIESLLEALGAEISEGRGSRVRVALKGVRAVFHRPHPRRETDKGAVVSVRRFWLFGLCYAMDRGYKGWNPYIERHLAIFVNCFLSRAN
ncbi:MAG: type II toxin-antitoxin system HicA family toxin, partial [Microcystis panniformis]